MGKTNQRKSETGYVLEIRWIEKRQTEYQIKRKVILIYKIFFYNLIEIFTKVFYYTEISRFYLCINTYFSYIIVSERKMITINFFIIFIICGIKIHVIMKKVKYLI